MAGNFSKWGFHSKETSPLYVVLFVSRNKDNKNLPDFVERRKAFITHKSKEELQIEFLDFVSHGVPEELCRFYISVNARNEDKIRKALIHKLIDIEDFALTSINGLLASIAADHENASEKKWLFDVDIDHYHKEELNEFINDMQNCDENITITQYKTPNGYALITDRGFDTRPLTKWFESGKITLKKDDMLCVDWKITDRIVN